MHRTAVMQTPTSDEQPLVLTVQDLETALIPIHDALGSIMESIMTLTKVISGLRPETVPARTATGTVSPVTTSITSTPELDRETLLKSLINPRTGGFVGVYSVNHRWQARLGANPIGYWDTAEEAALARHTAKTTGVTPPSTPRQTRVTDTSRAQIKLERERRKTLEAIEQQKAQARREELLIKNEAKLREVTYKEQLKVDADLARIAARGRIRTEALQLREDLITKRKHQDDQDDQKVIEDINNGWYPGKDSAGKTPDQIAAKMSSWSDDSGDTSAVSHANLDDFKDPEEN